MWSFKLILNFHFPNPPLVVLVAGSDVGEHERVEISGRIDQIGEVELSFDFLKNFHWAFHFILFPKVMELFQILEFDFFNFIMFTILKFLIIYRFSNLLSLTCSWGFWYPPIFLSNTLVAVEGRYVPLMIDSSTSCFLFSSSRPSGCKFDNHIIWP